MRIAVADLEELIVQLIDALNFALARRKAEVFCGVNDER